MSGQQFDYRGTTGWRATRDANSDLCEMSTLQPADAFASRSNVWHLGAAIFIDGRGSTVRFDRTAHHLSRAPVDHYQIRLYLRGTQHVWCGQRELVYRPGDIAVHDLACTSRTISAPAADEREHRLFVLFVPRATLAPLLARPDAVGSQSIDGASPLGGMVRSVLLAVRRDASRLTGGDGASAVDVVARLAAAALRAAPGAEPLIADAVAATKRAAIKRHLEYQPAGARVDVAALCRAFAVSRATLYRMFEPDGGLVGHVRRRQLRRALAVVTSPAHSHLRVVDIALQHGFRSESAFIRAFRRAFGVTPGELRADTRRSPHGLRLLGSGIEATNEQHWLRGLYQLEAPPIVR